jgi:anti-sigma-K factor RskA
MNEEIHELIIDLLTRKATVGLNAEDQKRLDRFNSEAGISEDGSFELAAAAIGLVEFVSNEPLPAHLHARILASADDYFAALPQAEAPAAQERTDVAPESEEYQKVFTFAPRKSWNWLGWAVAAAACVVLAINIWSTRMNAPELGGVTKTPPATPEKLTPEQELESLLASQPNMIKASWGAGNMKDLKEIGGDVVWSDEKQQGFMRLRGLPVNDKNKEQYQLWIFDKTQDPKKPIDGGVFDIPANGEVVIPINAKLKALGPSMFAITVEKPGGVVVSDRQKIAALAKVETPSRTNT